MSGLRTDLFPGPGEMRARMRVLDWANTSVGPVETWAQSLKSTVRTLLGSRYPMILLWGQELAQIYNDAYTGLIGSKHPGALGRSIRETQSESWDVIGPMITEVMTTGVPNWVEDQMLAVNRAGYNEEAHFSLSYSAVDDDEGVIRGMLCVCSEVTQQVLGERRLRLQRDLAARAGQTQSVAATCQDILSAIAEYPLDVPFALMYLLEPDSTLRLYGSVGVGGTDAIAPTVLCEEAASLWSSETVMAGRTALIDDLERHVAIQGGPWNEPVHRAIALPIPSSTPTAPLGVLIAGISPSRALDENYQSFYELLAGQVSVSIRNAQAYEEERQRAEMLAEIDQAKTAFFSNVSHEFRTPLTLMLGPLEDVLQSGHLPDAEREQITIAHRSSLRLLKLVNTLLDFSRIEAGRLQAVYEPTDLAVLTADLASLFRSAIEKAGLQLVVECAPLPESVYVDRDLWEKIVFNLLSNAFKFTQQGSITVRVGVVGETIELQVADTGSGIPESELDNVFKRFHRVEGTQGRTHEGSGIGLALVQELVQLHGGHVQVQSVYGQGSTFTVSIPRGKQHLPDDRIGGDRTLALTQIRADAFIEETLRWLPRGDEADKARDAQLPAPSAPAARILLVDDNADMREYVCKLLSTHYDVVAAADGEAAWTAAQEHVPDLVLSDVMMPNLDGFGLIARMREHPRTCAVPIVLLSARAGEESRVEGLEAGADDYLVKPFSARELLARVRATLETARLRREAARSRVENEAAKERAAILERVTDAFYGLDRHWRFTYVNRRCEEYLSTTREELLGEVIWDKFPMIKGTAFDEQYHKAVREQVAVHFEVLSPLTHAWVEVHVYPSTDGISVNFREITDRKQAEIERIQSLQLAEDARAKAEDANRIKDEFLAVLSHELRSPLNPILGWTSLLRSRSHDPITTERALDTIERNARLQARLVEDLLDISRILQGKLNLTIASVDLEQTIQAALETVRLAAEAKSISIITAFDPDIPQILGDPDRLQQVVWNLLSNAVKFTPAGGRVEISLEQRDAQAQIRVSDTGKGISRDFLPHVFDYFRQADSSTTRSFGGLGLGLAIVRQVVELHGGRVCAESPGEGHGSTFTVRLPLLNANKQTNGTLDPAASVSLDRIRVLVVDDDSDTREFLRFMLEQAGATVILAASASEALEVWAHSKPDVLLSDIGMPQSEGYGLIGKVRSLPTQQGGAIPAIALTAYAGHDDEQHTRSAGFQKHLAKPVEPSELIA
ncbi:response regulator, partial [Leptolyngbya sp. FACHB-36]|uniref:ATP-binding protein n=1 Tax=Leptolyngbya sp. FACHB-36 TaxID=2692808 RepID=UPI0016811270